MTICVNGIEWLVIFVSPYSNELVDRTNTRTLATTDPYTRLIFISKAISGELLERVVKHEVAHCIMASYGLVDYIHKITKRRYWLDAEEWVCNFIAEYNNLIEELSSKIIQMKEV